MRIGPGTGWRLVAAALLLAGRGALAEDARQPIPSGPELEALGAVVGQIHIRVGDILRHQRRGRRRLAVPHRELAAHVGHILPKGAMDAMRALGGNLDATGIDRDKMQADDSVAKDLMGNTLSGTMTQVVEEKPTNSPSTQAYLDRMSQNYFVCDGCGYIGKGETPVKCPVCAAEGDRFKQVDKTIFDAAAKAEGELETDLAYDDVPMQWTRDAKEAIRAVPAGFQRRRAKAKIEKTARKLGMTTITLEYAAPMIKEAAAEDYQPIFANKDAGTSQAAEEQLAAIANGTNGNGQGNGNGHVEAASPYTWTADATARLERAPEGFMQRVHEGIDREACGKDRRNPDYH